MNKVSHLRFKEELERGFDIITNDNMESAGVQLGIKIVKEKAPRGVWTRALAGTNRDFMTESSRKMVECEEEEKKKAEALT